MKRLLPTIFTVSLVSILRESSSSKLCCPFQAPCQCLRNLKLIDCAGQGLTSIPSHIYHDCLSGYKFLSLRGNQISCPNFEDLDGLGRLAIDLRHNPLNCSCFNLPTGNISITSQCSVPTHSQTATLPGTYVTVSPSMVITLSTSTHRTAQLLASTYFSTKTITTLSSTTVLFSSASIIKPTRSSTLLNSQTYVIINEGKRRKGVENDLKLIIETSAGVPVALLIFGIGIILYKKIKKYFIRSSQTSLNTLEALEMESDDDIVIYSTREDTMEESRV